MGPITHQHLENLWSPAPPRTQELCHFTPNITKLRASLKLEALLSLLMVPEAQQFQHLHVVHASLHLPLVPESLEHHGHPNMLPNEPMNHVTHRGCFVQERFLTRSPLNPVSPLDPATPIFPCQRSKHSSARFWCGSTDLRQTRPGSERCEDSLYPLTLCSLCSSSSCGTRRPRRSNDPRWTNDPCDTLRWRKATHERPDSNSGY